METLHEAYQLAKKNDGAPGSDGVTFAAIEESGVESFLNQIRDELVTHTYRPMRARKKEIPKDGGKVRVLSIPAIRDRVVQGALKLILEPIFEADFQPGSYGYRPKRTAHQAVNRVAQAIVEEETRIIDIDLRAYFDNVQHYLLLEKVARRVQDDEVMHLLKMMLKATGEKGVPQGGVISPMLSNLYLTEVDRMLEKAIATTRYGKYTYVQYARFADDLAILLDSHSRHDWLVKAVDRRLREELAKLRVEINEEKSRMVDLAKGESFSFLGFEYRHIRSRKRVWRPYYAPKLKKRTALFAKLREVFRRNVSQPVGKAIEEINPILRGWVNYFRVGHSNRCFSMVKHPLLICDEAQLLCDPALEQLPLLLNFDMDSSRYLTLLLVGQPLLRRTLSLQMHEPLCQRIAVQYHLEGLSREELDAYMSYHSRPWRHAAAA